MTTLINGMTPEDFYKYLDKKKIEAESLAKLGCEINSIIKTFYGYATLAGIDGFLISTPDINEKYRSVKRVELMGDVYDIIIHECADVLIGKVKFGSIEIEVQKNFNVDHWWMNDPVDEEDCIECGAKVGTYCKLGCSHFD